MFFCDIITMSIMGSDQEFLNFSKAKNFSDNITEFYGKMIYDRDRKQRNLF